MFHLCEICITKFVFCFEIKVSMANAVFLTLLQFFWWVESFEVEFVPTQGLKEFALASFNSLYFALLSCPALINHILGLKLWPYCPCHWLAMDAAVDQ